MKEFVVAVLGNLVGMSICLFLWKFSVYKKNRRNNVKKPHH